MKYQIETIGVELEYADIDTRKPLPKGLRWDYKDYSMCNSNGTANDPKKRMNVFGSEIHTKPTAEISEIMFLVSRFQQGFPEAKLNYTTNLHIHIRVPGLRNDLDALKKLASYYHKNAIPLFKLLPHIPIPIRENFKKEKAFDGAYRRYKRRHRSHQYIASENVFDQLMEAKTTEDFNLAHYPRDKKGKPQLHLMQREGVNLAHLFKPTETIEFRHFTMTKKPNRFHTALIWPRLYLKAALYTDEPPESIIKRHKELEFQPFFKYRYSLDKIFRRTNYGLHSREEIEAEYQRLIRKGKLTLEDLR